MAGSLTELEGIISILEKKFQMSFPIYLKNILANTGFDNRLSLSKFDENKDIKDIEHFIKNDYVKLLTEDEKINMFGIFSRNMSLFRIPIGHRILLSCLKEEIQKDSLERDKLKRKSIVLDLDVQQTNSKRFSVRLTKDQNEIVTPSETNPADPKPTDVLNLTATIKKEVEYS